MGRVRGASERALVLLGAVLAAVYGLLLAGQVPDEGLLVSWSAAAALLVGLSVGPVAVLAVAAAIGLAAPLLGLPGDLVVVELLAALLAGPVTWAIERSPRRRPRRRTWAAMAEFAALAGLLAPALVGGAVVLLGLDHDPLQQAGRVAVGAVAAVPGARVLVMGLSPRRPGRREALLAVVAVAAAVGLAFAPVAAVGGVPAVVLAPLVLAAALTGYATMAVLLAAATVLVSAGLAGLAPGLSDAVGAGDLLGVLLVVLVGYVVAVEYDRLRDLGSEQAALFGDGVTPVAVVRLPDLAIERVSGSFVRLVRVPEPGLLRLSLDDLLDVADDEPLEDVVDGRTTSARLDVSFEVYGERRSGVAVLQRAARDAPLGDALIVQVTDTTDLVAHADELRRANEALSRMAGRAVHDLKQPLAAVAGYAETLTTHLERLDHDTVRTMAGRLEAAALQTSDRLDRMINDARRAGEGAREVDLDDLVRGLEPVFTTDVDVELVRRLDVTRVTTDAVMLHTVLGNLVANAVKYRRPGHGRVTVLSRGFTSGTVITVADDGIGVPVHQLGRVLESGVRLREVDAPGSGTGLADAAAAARASGATLRALPSVNGARFELWVPSSVGGPPPTTVLLGIRDASDRVVVRTVLRLDGRTRDVGDVDRISDLAEAVEQVRPDVLLLDEQLVDGATLNALPDLLRRHPDQRVVLAAGSTVGHADGFEGLSRLARQRGASETVRRQDLDHLLLPILDRIRPAVG